MDRQVSQPRNYDHVFDLLLILAGLLNAMFLAAFQVWSTELEGTLKATSLLFASTTPLLVVIPIYSFAKACPQRNKILNPFLRVTAYAGILGVLTLYYFWFMALSVFILLHSLEEWMSLAILFAVGIPSVLAVLVLFVLVFPIKQASNRQKLLTLLLVSLAYFSTLVLPSLYLLR